MRDLSLRSHGTEWNFEHIANTDARRVLEMIEFGDRFISNAIPLTDLDKRVTGFHTMLDMTFLDSFRGERGGGNLNLAQRVGLLLLLLAAAGQPKRGGGR
jgi:hypothetical protein